VTLKGRRDPEEELGMVAPAYNPSTQETKRQEDEKFEASLGYIDPCLVLKNKPTQESQATAWVSE
jgi:hypothetical protein